MAFEELSEDYVSRQEAKAKGLKRYFTGIVCRNGHIAERYVCDNVCVDCGREKRKRYRIAHPEKVKEEIDNWRLNNKERMYVSRKLWVENNKERVRTTLINYKVLNIGKIRLQRNEYQKSRRENDLSFKLAQNLRTRLNQAIKKNSKSGSAVRDLGCSIEELKDYLQAKFKEGMTWDNWGKVWHIDHIEPLCSFDLTSEDDFKIACHYTNLEPLYIEINHYKIKLDKQKSIKVNKISNLGCNLYQDVAA